MMFKLAAVQSKNNRSLINNKVLKFFEWEQKYVKGTKLVILASFNTNTQLYKRNT